MAITDIVHINGTSLNVQTSGTKKPTLIFLHYWGGSLKTWKHVIKSLPEDYSTIAFDARGWAESGKPANGYSIVDLADDAEKLIQHYKIKDYILVGHSMGAKISQLIASRRPAGLLGLVLVAPAPPVPMAISQEAREQMVHAYSFRESIGFVLDNVLTSTQLTAEDREQVIADSMSGTQAAKSAWPMEAMLEDISSQVVNINIPTLVVAAEGDKVETIDTIKREVVPLISGAELKVIPDCGHLIPMEAYSILTEYIIEFHSKFSQQ